MEMVMEFYARMLEAQAELQFPFEKFLYADAVWRDARVIVDFGCGDGSYLALLAREYPKKRYFGVEIDDTMRAIAERKRRHGNISFHKSLGEIEGSPVDFFLMRYVVMHLEDRARVFRTVRERSSDSAALLIIEPDDGKIKIDPPFSLLEEAVARIQAASRHRNLRDRLDDELEIVGFELADAASPIISNGDETLDRKILRYAYSLIELGLQANISQAQKASLLDWGLSKEQSVQFGFDGRLYVRQSPRAHADTAISAVGDADCYMSRAEAMAIK